MRIIVLDGHTANPGDLNWRELEVLGECRVYDRTPANEIVIRSEGAEIFLTNKVVLNKAIIESLPSLRYIGVTATGYNVVDVLAAKSRGITVTNVPAYSTASVAQAVFALILELTNHVGHHDQTVHKGRWQAGPDFCYWDKPIIELSGLTMGIIGFGDIGQNVASLAHAFGMRVLVHTRTRKQVPSLQAEFCDFEELMPQSDIVSLHCPLTPETKGLINANSLPLMKPSALLINTARGSLVEETDLAAALNNRLIAGAGVDVFSVEPPREGNPLLDAQNCIITPHIAWASYAARKRLLDTVFENLRAFLKGQPANVVNA